MMLKLLDYQFKVTYKKGKELHVADMLSRAALKDSFESQQSDVFTFTFTTIQARPLHEAYVLGSYEAYVLRSDLAE